MTKQPFDKEYFTNYGGIKGTDYTTCELSDFSCNPTNMKAMLDILGCHPKSMYDIGAANGRLLLAAKKTLDLQYIAGCEISEYMYNQRLPDSGDITLGDLYELIPAVHRTFDIVFSCTAMYMENINLYLETIKQLGTYDTIFIHPLFFAITYGMYWRKANVTYREPYADSLRTNEYPKTWWYDKLRDHKFVVLGEDTDNALYFRKAKPNEDIINRTQQFIPRVRYPSLTEVAEGLKNPFVIQLGTEYFLFSWINEHEVIEYGTVLTEERAQSRLTLLPTLFSVLMSKQFVPAEMFYLRPMPKYLFCPMYYTIPLHNLYYMSADSMVTGRWFKRPSKHMIRQMWSI